MNKLITCPYCGTTKHVRPHAETCGSGICRMKKHRDNKKQEKVNERQSETSRDG